MPSDSRQLSPALRDAALGRPAARRAALFLVSAVLRPATVGALLPSSRHLATAMADACGGARQLVELGAGTGAITEALCRQHPDVPTIAVEMDPRLAHLLGRRFPAIDIRIAAAHRVLHDLRDAAGAVVLVSSLPFRSMPRRWRLSSSQAIEQFLLAEPARRLVQFTYQPRAPFDLLHQHALQWRRLGVVWRNAPPAWVWELGRRGVDRAAQPGH